MTATVTRLYQRSPARLQCSACGATADASCDCGAPYVPSTAQKREVVAEELKADPEKSDRQVAKATGTSHHTVASVRNELEDGGQIAHHDDHVGSDGVRQPAKKAATKPRTDLHQKPSAPPRGSEAICARVREAVTALSGLPPPAEVVGYFAGTDTAIIVNERLAKAATWIEEFRNIWKEAYNAGQD